MTARIKEAEIRLSWSGSEARVRPALPSPKVKRVTGADHDGDRSGRVGPPGSQEGQGMNARQSHLPFRSLPKMVPDNPQHAHLLAWVGRVVSRQEWKAAQ